MNDLTFACRQLVKNRGFTLVAVLTLALGIGSATAIFSVVYGVLINPYPYAKAGEIWTPGLHSPSGEQPMRPYRMGEFTEMCRLATLSDVMATRPDRRLLKGEFAPENVTTVLVTSNAFHFLGVAPVIGRTIQASDVHPGGEVEPVTVLSYQFWQNHFGGSPDALGKTLLLNDLRYTIVGVMPPRFGWWTSDGVWLPMAAERQSTTGVFPIVRLRPGIESGTAQQEWHALQLELAKLNPGGFPKDEFTSTLTNYLNMTVARGEMQRSLRLLLGAVGFLLLIACANVANLQLARGTARSREMAVRLAVGADRRRLIRQLLTESVLLSLMGGLLGLVFASWITALMVKWMPSFYVPNEARIEVNGTVLLFCLGVSTLTGIIFGLAPALEASRPNLSDALKDESRGSSALTAGRLRALLVVSEVALSVVLLVSAGSTIRSFIALQQVDLGFQPERVITMGLPLRGPEYATWEQRNRFARDLLDRVEHLPGVRSAAIGNGGLPFRGPESTYIIEGLSDDTGEKPTVTFQLVSANYLQTIGIPLLRGRMPSQSEIDSAQPLAVVNEAAAKLWRHVEDPIGHRIRLDQIASPEGSELKTSGQPDGNLTVIGIIPNTRNDGLRNDTRPVVLVPYTLLAPPTRVLAVRAHGDPGSLVQAIRMQVLEMDPEQPLEAARLLEEAVLSQKVQPRFLMALFSTFAACGLALCTAGIYSVLSYVVTRRTRDIGVRLALGAQRGDVLRLVFGMGGRMAGLGTLIGCLASLGVARFLASQIELFRVPRLDVVSFASVLVGLGVVVAGACLVPARRAAKTNPIEALRCE